MDKYNIVYALVREGLQIEKADSEYVVGLSSCQEVDWTEIYQLASIHGVAAITFEGLKRWTTLGDFKRRFPFPLLMQWGGKALQTEKVYQRQLNLEKELSEIFFQQGITTFALKGIALSRYYPFPDQRPCCDFDCYLSGQYAEGNRVARAAGAQVEDGGYKHSHIRYKGLMVENHQFIIGFNGTKRGSRLERLLEELIAQPNTGVPIADAHILSPSPLFNALFLLKHANGHFASEGLSIRHLADWSLFLQQEQGNVDWGLLNGYLDEFGLRPFADLITTWCVKHLKLAIRVPGVYRECSAALLGKLEADLLGEHRSTNGLAWWQKLPVLVFRFRRMWRFREILDESIGMKLWNTLAYSSYWHRTPKLE